MSTITMPHSGGFNFKCIHCGFDTGKPPINKKQKGQGFTMFYCGQCHEKTLIRFDDTIATIFKVVS